jgi:NAD(P)H-hydrate epimerase
MFQTEHGLPVPAVTEEEMRQIDQTAVEEFNLSILQMMENAGRALAENALAMLGSRPRSVTVLAGPGGNGGGGICAARHMHNRGLEVTLVLASSVDDLHNAAASQFEILRSTKVSLVPDDDVKKTIRSAALVVDALLGYSLHGAPKGRVKELIEICNREAARVLSLDIPSGMNATTGDVPGVTITDPERTLTLALPKTGLSQYRGEIYLADIGIPPEVYEKLDLHFGPLFGTPSWLRLKHTPPAA